MKKKLLLLTLILTIGMSASAFANCSYSCNGGCGAGCGTASCCTSACNSNGYNGSSYYGYGYGGCGTPDYPYGGGYTYCNYHPYDWNGYLYGGTNPYYYVSNYNGSYYNTYYNGYYNNYWVYPLYTPWNSTGSYSYGTYVNGSWVGTPYGYCTLSFETNGGSSINSVTLPYGAAYDTRNYTTSKAGYTLEGWYLEPGFATRVVTSSLTFSRTIYAKWVQDKPVGPVATSSSNAHDAGSGIRESVNTASDGSAFVSSVEGGLAKATVTGFTLLDGIRYSVKEFGSNAFSDIDKVVIDLREASSSVKFSSGTFNQVRIVVLKGYSAEKFHFRKGAFDGVEKVAITGMQNGEFSLMERKLKASGFRGVIQQL